MVCTHTGKLGKKIIPKQFMTKRLTKRYEKKYKKEAERIVIIKHEKVRFLR